MVVFAACDGDDGPDRPGDTVTEEGSATEPGIPQARWKLKAKMAPGHPRLTKKQRKAARAQVSPIRKLIEETYFALFLEPAGRKKILGKRFTKPTATALLKTRAGVPSGATRVRTTLRKGTIGIDPMGARFAAAKIAVKARGQADEGSFRITHKARLWLERSSGRWKVIAFDIDQGPS